MLKKEFRDTMKNLLESSLLLLGFPFILLMDVLFLHLRLDPAELINGLSLFTMLVFAVYSGLTLFYREEKERALEYLLSLPISRAKILFYKILPRLAVLLVFLFIYALLFGIDGSIPFKIRYEILPTVILSFLLALFAGLASRNLAVGFIGVFLLMNLLTLSADFFFNATAHLKGYMVAMSSVVTVIIPGLLLLVPLAISFFLSYMRLGDKPPRKRLMPYLYIALPVILAQALLLVFQNKLLDYIKSL
ncbi:MAG: ABC transporter permease subunit [Candidatus Aminicenantes bacterium]|nr:ABC transporter permease subunit [Candidatus Aminicenantes bacterium]